jgi:cytochrome oxidase Cu insertion factor (SCO1/SenC/PrrC family)
MSRKKARQKRGQRKYSIVEIAGFAAVGIFIIGIIWLAFLTPSPPASQTMTGTLAPDFTLTDVDGNTFRLSDQQGKVVVLMFMYTKCPACVAASPYARELRAKFGGNVAMVMISTQPSVDTDSVLRDYRNENAMGWTAIGDTAQVSLSYAVQYTPTIIIIDKNGYIRYQHVGLTESSILMVIGEVESLTK